MSYNVYMQCALGVIHTVMNNALLSNQIDIPKRIHILII